MARDPKDIDRERAIALKYHNADQAPTIVAKGYGELAREIVKLAEAQGISVSQDDTLSEVLAKVELGGAISEESFKLVAEVLCFLYITDQEWRKEHPHLKDVIEQDEKS